MGTLAVALEVLNFPTQKDSEYCWLAHLVELCYTEVCWKLPDEIEAPGSSKDIFLWVIKLKITWNRFCNG